MKIVGYIRASTLEQEETLKTQREKIEAYCLMRGFELVHIYVDAGISGSAPLEERKQGAELLQAFKGRGKNRIDGIVSVKLDRMFRNAGNCLHHVETWAKQGVALHLVDLGGQSIDTSSATGKMFITMMAGMAEWERGIIAERTSAVLQSKKARCEVYSPTPLGFDSDGERLTPNADERALIDRIKAMRASGMSMWKIANTLNAEGIQGKKKGRWYAATIRNVLSAA